MQIIRSSFMSFYTESFITCCYEEHASTFHAVQCESHIHVKVVQLHPDGGGSVQVATRAATAAGFLCNGDASKEVLTGVLESLIKTSNIKSEALHFAVGEALCFLFGGEMTCSHLAV